MAALPQDFERAFGLSPEAYPIVQHAYETFGSMEKAQHWLERPNPLFAGSSALEILRNDPTRFALVDDELTRIDYGIFA
jgi:uncharacterized protein (DUF2384 family)